KTDSAQSANRRRIPNIFISPPEHSADLKRWLALRSVLSQGLVKRKESLTAARTAADPEEWISFFGRRPRGGDYGRPLDATGFPAAGIARRLRACSCPFRASNSSFWRNLSPATLLVRQ